MFNWLFKKHLCQMTPEQQLAKEIEGVEFFERGVFEMKKEDSKPRIVLLRKWDGGVYYKCSYKKLEAYGSTPEEAFEMWRQISSVNEWRLLLRQGFNDPQLNIGAHRHEEIKPFSLLKYVETSYSNSSIPLS